MAFQKTGIALNTRVLKDGPFVPDGHPPMDPRVGDRWEGLVWDGGAWVQPEVFERSRK